MTKFRMFLLAFALIVSVPSAYAETATQPVASIEFVGSGAPVAMTVESLSALPQVEQEVTFKTSKGMSTGKYKGPLLWEVVKASKSLDGLERNKELAKTLLVTASDGYQIAFSIGELSPEFGNATILLALETDGQSLKDGFRIVAQGDQRGARAVHNIVKIEVR